MLRQTLQHFLIASSVLLNPNTLFKLVKQPNKILCVSCHKHFSFNRNEPFLINKQLFTKLSNTQSTYPSAKSLKQQIYLFKKQGVPQLTQTSKQMESSKEQMGANLPDGIKGMKTLDKGAFETQVTLPCVIVSPADLQKVMYMVKPFLFKMQKLNTVMEYDEAKFVMKTDESNHELITTDSVKNKNGEAESSPKFQYDAKSKVILLNPRSVKTFDDFGTENLERLATTNLTASNFAHTKVTLTYDNFSAEDILKAVLPSMISSFTSVGHIVQCNLREEHMDYRYLIGQVILDKVPQCETVVNKAHGIDNTYRNFEMELLAGKDEMVTVHREHGCQFKMDFSKVYWNSRLSTEHDRVVKDISDGNLVLDVFAGVGPFSIPAAAHKGARVVANDLNPDSVHWLKTSIALNARQIKHPIIVCNKDAQNFLQEDARAHLTSWIQDCTKTKRGNTKPDVVVIMNLPASAIEYVKYLRVLSKDDFEKLEQLGPLPVLYLYVFLPKMNLETKEPIEAKIAAAQLFESHGLVFDEGTMNVRFVRNVAPNKNMYKVVVPLGREFLVEREIVVEAVGEKREGEGNFNEEETKKIKLDH